MIAPIELYNASLIIDCLYHSRLQLLFPTQSSKVNGWVNQRVCWLIFSNAKLKKMQTTITFQELFYP